MFKRFLKFLKGDAELEETPFEGSYLDHLFAQVRPQVSSQLDACPTHDPYLLVVVNVLRTTLPGAWAEGLREPLEDGQTPGAAPPPPPSTPAPSDGTEEVDIVGEGTDAPEESVDDGDIVEADQSSQGENWSRITEEIDIAEIHSAKPDDSEAEGADSSEVIDVHDATVEMDKEIVSKASDLPRVDSQDVLTAGRLFLALLLENEELPTDLQLSVSELMLARDLLLGYFVGDETFDAKAKRLLGMVEKKFGDGFFSQARILLQLFQTDESTRVNNDRNLFYEDMILRLGIRRRHQLSADELDEFKELGKNAVDDEGIRALAEWLDTACLIKLHLFLTDPEASSVWSGVLAKCERKVASEAFLDQVPPRRWRTLDTYPTMTVSEQAHAHISEQTARRYVIGQLKTCYFILRAVGDTGLEGFLDSFFDWTKATFDVNGTRLMPLLYNRSMMDTDAMNAILEDIYETFFAEGVARLLAEADEAAIDAALDAAIKGIAKARLGDVAPGYYDLGGFIYDNLLGVSYPTREFAAKLHRIT